VQRAHLLAYRAESSTFSQIGPPCVADVLCMIVKVATGEEGSIVDGACPGSSVPFVKGSSAANFVDA
jgi:hypothetical protein